TGIKSAALTSALPMTFDVEQAAVVPQGYEFPQGQRNVEVLSYVVDDHYFETLGVPILAGRGFISTDREGSPRGGVVNEAFAREYLGPNPIGKRLRLGARETAVEVVGVTMTGKTFSLVEPPVQVVYLPFRQNPRGRMTLIAETTGDPTALISPLLDRVRSVDPIIPVFRVRTMEDLFERSTV